MAITLNGTTGITTPDIDTDGLSVDTNAIFVDPATNNVGIGTSSPFAKIATEVSSGATFKNCFGATNGVNSDFIVRIQDNNTNLLNSVGALSFSTANTERARIDSNGNLLVGTTSNPNGSKLVFDGNGLTVCTTIANATTAYSHFLFRNPNGIVGGINTNGSTTAFITSSDYRLKENVAPMQNALTTVAQLNPVTYNWKVDGSVGQGFIAHELQAVVPDCVTGEKDEVRTVDVHDEEGKVIGTKEEPQYQGVDTSFLVGVLTAAIQEQQTLIQALTARIEALEQA